MRPAAADELDTVSRVVNSPEFLAMRGVAPGLRRQTLEFRSR